MRTARCRTTDARCGRCTCCADRAGPRNSFPSASPIIVEAAPDKVDPNSCYLNTIRFSDGTHMDRYGQYVKGTGGALTEVRGPIAAPATARRPERRPSGEPNISGDWAPEQLVMANPRGTGGGLVPLGTLPQVDAAGAPARRRRRSPRRPAGRPAPVRRDRADRRRHAGGSGLQRRRTTRASAARRPASSSTGRSTARSTASRRTRTQSSCSYGQMGLKRTIYMNVKDHPAAIEADARRPLDRPLGGRHAGCRHRSVPAGRAERAGPQQRQASRRRALHARSRRR